MSIPPANSDIGNATVKLPGSLSRPSARENRSLFENSKEAGPLQGAQPQDYLTWQEDPRSAGAVCMRALFLYYHHAPKHNPTM